MTSRKSVAIGVAALLMSAGATQAADLYTPVPAAASWTGFYFGGQIGGVFDVPGHPNGCSNPSAYDLLIDPVEPLNLGGPNNQPVYDYSDSEIEDADCYSSSSGDSSGFAGGIRGGYDFQNGSVVFGILGDYNFTDVSRSSMFEFDLDFGVATGTQTGSYNLPDHLWNINTITPPGGTEASERGTPFQSLAYETSLEGFGTVRGRLGMAVGAEERFLLFVSGGLAFGQVKSKWSQTAEYTPDEADRVFDTPTGPNSDDGEFFPGTETVSLPSNCEATEQYPGSGAPGQGQTGVICSDSGSKNKTQVGFAVGAGGEYLVSDNVSIGGEVMYINLGDVAGPAGDMDFWTAMATMTFRFN